MEFGIGPKPSVAGKDANGQDRYAEFKMPNSKCQITAYKPFSRSQWCAYCRHYALDLYECFLCLSE
jgi:hypothetical protein